MAQRTLRVEPRTPRLYDESQQRLAQRPIIQLVIQLGTKVNAGLKLPALKTASISAPAAKSPNQFKAIMAMSQAIEAEDRKDKTQAVSLYKQAIALNPDFDRAKVRLASIEK